MNYLMSLVPSQYQMVAKFFAIGALVALFTLYSAFVHHEGYVAGMTDEKVKRDQIDLQNKAAAQSELLAANEKTKEKQSQLDSALNSLQKIQEDYDHAKQDAIAREDALRSNVDRLRVLVSQSSISAAGQSTGSSAAAVDRGPAVTADLDTAVAANLERHVSIGDQAIRRLNGCIEAYEAVRKSINKE